MAGLVPSWQDSGVINASSGLSGGIKMRSATGGIKFSASGIAADDMYIAASGKVGIGTSEPSYRLHVTSGANSSEVILAVSTAGSTSDAMTVDGKGWVTAKKFIGDGSGLTNLPPGGSADNLGNHVATTTLNMNTYNIINVSTMAMTGSLTLQGSSFTITGGLAISTGGAITTTGVGLGTVSGDPRGFGAVDLQTFRTNVSSVASGLFAVISGGSGNKASDIYATVGGGFLNMASNDYATIGGGYQNTASGTTASTIGGGYQNTAAGNYATVAGGIMNTAGAWGMIGGGWGNQTTGQYSTIGGGWGNRANSDYSTVPGGKNNTAGNNYSFAAGYMSSSTANGAFTWSDSLGLETTNSVANRTWFKNQGGFLTSVTTNSADGFTMLFNASGNVGVGSITPVSKLHVLDSGSQPLLIASHTTGGYGLYVSSWAHVGIGTSTTRALLSVVDNAPAVGDYVFMVSTGASDTQKAMWLTGDGRLHLKRIDWLDGSYSTTAAEEAEVRGGAGTISRRKIYKWAVSGFPATATMRGFM